MKDKSNKIIAYTAANSLPIKIFKNADLLEEIISDGKIIPFHIQFIPTNRCNLKCPFCSCSERDKKLEMSREMCKDVISTFKGLGTKAVTITGGGEPLLYKNIDMAVNGFYSCGIKVGLVTNGLLLKDTNYFTINKLTWCRISSGDHREFSGEYKSGLERVVNACNNVDWAFSHVVSKNPNYKTIGDIVSFANEHDFTHVRLVSNLFEPESISLDGIKTYLNSNNIEDDKVIYQDRKSYVKGSKNCLISLLKPVIGPDGSVYPCCGVQYAEKEPSKDLSNTMNMGSYKEFVKLYKKTKCFDGSKCVKCYYEEYNSILGILSEEIKHGEFV